MIRIEQISTPTDFLAIKGLIHEFVAWVGTQDPDAQSATTFKDLDAELEGLPGIFGPPTGSFLMATVNDQAVGCVAFRELDADTVELKRMFVRPGQRGGGIGKKLVEELMIVARAQGRSRMVLRSYFTMTDAHKLYRTFGFQDIPAPDDLPEHYVGRIVFMQMDL